MTGPGPFWGYASPGSPQTGQNGVPHQPGQDEVPPTLRQDWTPPGQDRTAERVLSTLRAVCLLRSHSRKLLVSIRYYNLQVNMLMLLNENYDRCLVRGYNLCPLIEMCSSLFLGFCARCKQPMAKHKGITFTISTCQVHNLQHFSCKNNMPHLRDRSHLTTTTWLFHAVRNGGCLVTNGTFHICRQRPNSVFSLLSIEPILSCPLVPWALKHAEII